MNNIMNKLAAQKERSESELQRDEKQLNVGILPPGTKLTERWIEISSLDDLSDGERKLYARQIEVFAAMLDHVDDQIGKMIDKLEQMGELDNTLNNSEEYNILNIFSGKMNKFIYQQYLKNTFNIKGYYEF